MTQARFFVLALLVSSFSMAEGSAVGTWLFSDATVKQYGADIRTLVKLKISSNQVSNVTECSTTISRVLVVAKGDAEITDSQIIVNQSADTLRYLDVNGNLFACIAHVHQETNDYQMVGQDQMLLKDPATGEELSLKRLE